MRYFPVLILFLASFELFAQSFHDEVLKVYNFAPHELTDEQEKGYMVRVDGFFNKVVKHKAELLGSLRAELRRADNPPYFYFDAGFLLMELSKSEEDLQLAADALAKTDLRDFSTKFYLEHLLSLSDAGADATEAALHILDDPSFRLIIAEPAAELNRCDCMKFVLLRYKPEVYVMKLIARYYASDSLAVKKAVVELLFYSCCCTADGFINALQFNTGEPADVRKTAADFAGMDFGDRENNNVEYFNLHERIKTVLARIDESALYVLNNLIRKMKRAYACDC